MELKLQKLPAEVARTEKEKTIVEHFNNIVENHNKAAETLEDLRKTLLYRTFGCQIDWIGRIVREGKIIKSFVNVKKVLDK